MNKVMKAGFHFKRIQEGSSKKMETFCFLRVRLVEIKTLWPTERHYSNKRRIFTEII